MVSTLAKSEMLYEELAASGGKRMFSSGCSVSISAEENSGYAPVLRVKGIIPVGGNPGKGGKGAHKEIWIDVAVDDFGSLLRCMAKVDREVAIAALSTELARLCSPSRGGKTKPRADHTRRVRPKPTPIQR